MEPMIQADQAEWTTTQEAAAVTASQRDPAAFTPLYRHYVDLVYRYLYSRVGNLHDAQDLTSQVFLSALEGIAAYHDDGHFAAWLFGIARHKATDYFRHRHPDVLLEDIPDPGGGSDLLGMLIKAEEAGRLRKQIAVLETADQELLRLRFVAGLSFTEMAILLKRSPDAVKKSVYRLVERLRMDSIKANAGVCDNL